MPQNTQNGNFISKNILSEESAERISSKQEDIQHLASSRDGQMVKNMLEEAGLEQAMSSGDMSAILSAVKGVLKTDAGSRFIQQLSSMMNGKDETK